LYATSAVFPVPQEDCTGERDGSHRHPQCCVMRCYRATRALLHQVRAMRSLMHVVEPCELSLYRMCSNHTRLHRSKCDANTQPVTIILVRCERVRSHYTHKSNRNRLSRASFTCIPHMNDAHDSCYTSSMCAWHMDDADTPFVCK
jgi:hypothetical protein